MGTLSNRGRRIALTEYAFGRRRQPLSVAAKRVLPTMVAVINPTAAHSTFYVDSR